MHFDCAMYAVRVCPYIANPGYLKRIDDRTLRPEHMPDNMKIVSSPLSTDKTPPLFILSQARRHTTFVPSQHRATGQLLWKVSWQDWHALIPFRAGVALAFDDAVRLHIATHLLTLPGVESIQAAGMMLAAVLDRAPIKSLAPAS